MGLLIVAVAGCGQNRFEQEVRTEQSAVKLAREVVKGDYDLITTDELNSLLDEKAGPLLVDAMPYEASYRKQHIAGAVQFLFPKTEMDEWDPKQTDGKTTEDFEKLLGEDKDLRIVVYCGFTACARSHNAAMWARRLGYTNVARYPGGIYAWKGAGLPTEAAAAR